ncbi:unnamed protein product, partial [Urochloa humidicola]
STYGTHADRLFTWRNQSSGLDPTSRRALWHAVLSAKQNKAIVLTTHSMDEAEALCVASKCSLHWQQCWL